MRYGFKFDHRTGKKRYFIDGAEVSRREYDRRTPHRLHELAAGVPGGSKAGCWPMESDAAGVNPAQRHEAMKAASELGVPTEFNAEGNPVFRTRGHRKRYLRAIKMHDRDAGYGDPTPD